MAVGPAYLHRVRLGPPLYRDSGPARATAANKLIPKIATDVRRRIRVFMWHLCGLSRSGSSTLHQHAPKPSVGTGRLLPKPAQVLAHPAHDALFVVRDRLAKESHLECLTLLGAKVLGHMIGCARLSGSDKCRGKAEGDKSK